LTIASRLSFGDFGRIVIGESPPVGKVGSARSDSMQL
jgi:hypothetical protein